MNDFLEQWIIKAENDLTTAKHELDLPEDQTVTDSVCFHSQQAVEKFLKAYLIFKNEDFGRTHNLEFLLQLCIKHDDSFAQCELGNLSEYAVNLRYPDDFYIPNISEANAAYKLALEIRQFIIDNFDSVMSKVKKRTVPAWDKI